MRADVSRLPAPLGRLAPVVCAVVFAGVACNSIPEGEVRFPEGRSFLAMVPDSVDDVGVDPSITVSGDGVPYVTYFGFPAKLSANDIPVSRPVGAPYLTTEDGNDAAAVLLASFTPDTQVWNRGAVAQPRETPAGVTVPFGPAPDDSLESVTPSNARGTDVAVSGSDVHAVWSASGGVGYGLGPGFELETIDPTPGAGAPSIAVDGSGAPLVAYVVARLRPEVIVAERVGERWRSTVVTTLSECGRECPPPAQLAVVGGEPLVVVVDPSTGDMIAASRQGSSWSTEVIARGVGGGGRARAAPPPPPPRGPPDDTAAIAYYTSDGVEVATGAPGNWQIDEVATVAAAPESPSPGPASEPIQTEPSTGVAVDAEGAVWVAWQDADGVHLASTGDGGDFQEQELNQTEGGVTPSVAVAEDGSSIYLAWFDPQEADLRVGISAELDRLLLAAPSPTPPPPSPSAAANCGQDGKVVLDIVAVNTTFDPTCLVAPAGEAFTVNFDNQDQGIPHNFEILPEPGGEVLAGTEPKPGTYTEPLNVDSLDAGSYYFQCVVHPGPMNGTLAVVEAKGGGGGQGGGGGNGGGGGGG
jgi:plastocyanin